VRRRAPHAPGSYRRQRGCSSLAHDPRITLVPLVGATHTTILTKPRVHALVLDILDAADLAGASTAKGAGVAPRARIPGTAARAFSMRSRPARP
jgi:hypothetical protein